MISVYGAGRSHGRAVGGMGTVVAEGREGGRPPVWARRQLIDGIRFRVRTGIPWRDIPVEYGPWGRVYDLFRRWQRDGTWHRMLTKLQSLPTQRARPHAKSTIGNSVVLRDSKLCARRSGAPATPPLTARSDSGADSTRHAHDHPGPCAPRHPGTPPPQPPAPFRARRAVVVTEHPNPARRAPHGLRRRADARGWRTMKTCHRRPAVRTGRKTDGT